MASPSPLAHVAALINASLSSSKAGVELGALEGQPGFLSALLALIRGGDATVPPLVPASRQLAAIAVRNLVRRQWGSGHGAAGAAGAGGPPPEERAAARPLLLALVEAEASDHVASQLTIALAKVARADWPRAWPDLMPALLGRIVTIPYYPLSDDMLARIVRLQLERIRRRVQDNHRIPFTYSDDAVKLIVKRCNNAESGGRIIDAILTNTVLPKVSIEYLSRTAEGRPLQGVNLDAEGSEFSYRFD